MALIFPSFEILERQKVKLTDGESKLLRFLYSVLDDSFEIYSQPFLNGDRPDIIIMRKGSGVLIIEVKDWNLSHYSVDKRGKWIVNDSIIRSPIQQVLTYKENLYNLHIANLLEKNIKEPKHWGIVNCAVYFHCENTATVNEFICKGANDKKKEFLSHFDFIGNDGLTKENIYNILKKRRLLKDSYFFSNELYKSIKIFLQPPQHALDDGKDIPYTQEQILLSISEEGKEQKIKGVAGCGKTLVLAKRAVNAHKRTNRKILILTYNITLINYIHDRISEVREEFLWDNFYINNYHDFISRELNNNGLQIKIPEDFSNWTNDKRDEFFEKYYSNEKLFESVKDKIYKYDAIFIDEVQDYKLQWLRIIKSYFLKNGGEFVLFGDEKQNIYKLEMETDKKPKTNILGAWNQSLNKTFRLSNKIAQIAIEFQKHFFIKKYDIDSMDIANPSLFDEKFVYLNFPEAKIDDVSTFILNESKKINAHPNDNCILSGKIDTLKDIDSFIRHSTLQNTQTMFETKEVLLKLLFDFKYDDKDKILDEGIKHFKNNINNLILALCYWEYLDSTPAQSKFQKIIDNSSFDIDSFRIWITKFVSSKEKYTLTNDSARYLYDNNIELIRKNKKRNFRMNPGLMKLSTTHSFKGWEIKNLFLVIENTDTDKFVSPELIYTALTRCRNNLFVFNIGNTEYHKFFGSLSN